jgi:type II secretory pathway component PulC
MAEYKITPEEKLLSIIEGSPVGPEGKSKGSSVNGWKSFLPKIFKLETVNVVLGIVCAGMLVFSVFNFIAGAGRYELFMAGFKPASVNDDLKIDNIAFGLDSGQSVDYAKKRNIFSLPNPVENGTVNSYAEKPMILNNLALVGVIWSETNPQAMIEDKAAGKTTLVSNGDLMGDFKVKKIEMDKVVLDNQDQEYVLQ